MDDLTRRFIDVFDEIHYLLAMICRKPADARFSALLDEARKRQPALEAFYFPLDTYRFLRNLLDNERVRGGFPIATPSLAAIRELQGIRDAIGSPKKLGDLPKRVVQCCSPTEMIGDVARKMRRRDYSQVPVYDGDECVGLLDANTIARWFGVKVEGIGILEEAPVKEVLSHEEKQAFPRYKFLAEKDTVLDALSAFLEALDEGVAFDAVVVTPTGRTTEKPTRILTPSDIPQLQKLAHWPR